MAVKQKAEEDAQAQIAAEKEAAEEREARARADTEVAPRSGSAPVRMRFYRGFALTIRTMACNRPKSREPESKY
jgi:hypothetical protein